MGLDGKTRTNKKFDIQIMRTLIYIPNGIYLWIIIDIKIALAFYNILWTR